MCSARGISLTGYTRAKKALDKQERYQVFNRATGGGKWTTKEALRFLDDTLGEHLRSYGRIDYVVRSGPEVGLIGPQMCHFHSVDNSIAAQMISGAAVADRAPRNTVFFHEKTIKFIFSDGGSGYLAVKMNMRTGAFDLNFSGDLCAHVADIPIPAHRVGHTHAATARPELGIVGDHANDVTELDLHYDERAKNETPDIPSAIDELRIRRDELANLTFERGYGIAPDIEFDDLAHSHGESADYKVDL